MTITHTEETKLLPGTLNSNSSRAEAIEQVTATLAGSKVLYTLILHYEYGKGNLQNVNLIGDSLKFDTDTLGTIEVGYDINEFSVCAALDFTGEYRMTVQFKIDVDNQVLAITGEERYE